MGDLWRIRRDRAAHLAGQTPHAHEILTFYVGLAEAQERVADQLPVADWLSVVRSDDGDFPWCRVARLPLDQLALPFQDLLSSVAGFGTERIKDGAHSLLSRNDDRRLDVLRTAVSTWGNADSGRKEDDVNGNEDDDSEQADEIDDFSFYARAFLEAVLTAIARSDSRQPTDWTQNSCYVCGAAPQVAVLRDLPDAVGRRSLVCSMCATEWRFQRLTCPHCGETEADKLPVHSAESIVHVRVDACTTCSRYIKAVDLRARGHAEPIVDELAAVELDVWAREQGLKKIRTNVLGL